MGVPAATASNRLRREDFKRTKHDSAFSPWKILIGESDWEDHFRGKEGAERYRTQNLPKWTSCSGVYELGIATWNSRSDRKLRSNSVICVYLGQADNLRTRLQRYGRDGAHLEGGRSNGTSSHCQSESTDKALRLFTDVFSRCLPIVYRCAPMISKKDAEMTEKRLLEKFDYAWNKGNNGVRRHDDICKKLDSLADASKFSLLVKNVASLCLNWRKLGIKIRASQPNRINMGKTRNISRVFRIKRVQQYSSADSSTDACGVSLGNGLACKARPVKGRKRCPLHKGMKVNGSTFKLDVEEKSLSHVHTHVIVSGGNRHDPSMSPSPCVPEQESVKHLKTGKHCFNGSDACGFLLEDGVPCQNKPVGRNKRCLEHKGRRIRQTKV